MSKGHRCLGPLPFSVVSLTNAEKLLIPHNICRDGVLFLSRVMCHEGVRQGCVSQLYVPSPTAMGSHLVRRAGRSSGPCSCVPALHGQELQAGSYQLHVTRRCYHWPLGSRNCPGSGPMAVSHQARMEIVEQLKLEFLNPKCPFLV